MIKPDLIYGLTLTHYLRSNELIKFRNSGKCVVARPYVCVKIPMKEKTIKLCTEES